MPRSLKRLRGRTDIGSGRRPVMISAVKSPKVQALEQQLEQLQAQDTQLRLRAAVVLANLARLRPHAGQMAVQVLDRATSSIAALIAQAAPLWSAWTSPDWARYVGAAGDACSHMRIGSLAQDDEPLPGEAHVELPWLLPLASANGAILLTCQQGTQELARKTLQSLVLRTALAMPGEVRLTLLDPIGLGAAFPFRSDLAARVRPSGRSVVDELAEIIEDIRRINERVIGHAARFADLTRDQRAGESFELVAVADFPRAYFKDPRAVEHLVRIANAGPRAGRHLVLEVNLDAPLPHDFALEQLEHAIRIDVRASAGHLDSPPPAARQHELLQVATQAGQEQRSADWESVVRPADFLTASSARRVETPVGERLRLWLGVDADGAPSSHAVIAGQPGAGKSRLLHVLITGLAARYAPQELQLVLIDGKDGIELEVYRELPQAQIICLRTLPAMARSVLADFVAEMEDRYRLFQAAGAVELEDYRRRTGQTLARKLLIVDEYQQLLEGDEERGGLLLTRILEKGRAAGTHVVLVSQTFSVRGMPPAALAHVHTRAALALAPDYVQGIQLFGAEGKRLIRELSPSGQVVINDRSGRDGASSRGAVARCHRGRDSDIVVEVIREIIETHGAPGRPVVLNGRDAAVVTDNPFVSRLFNRPPDAAALQRIARLPTRQGGFGLETWSAADQPVGLWLGRRFDVRGHALCALRRAPAQNALILGAHVDVRNRMLASGLAALPAMLAPSCLEVTLLDGLGADLPGGRMLQWACEQLKGAGAQVVIAGEGSCEAPLEALATSLGGGADASRTRLLIIAEPDYLPSLHGSADRFAPPTTGPAAHLRTVLTRGPQHGLHGIVTASGLAALGAVVSPSRDARFFNHRVVQQMNEDESMTLFASLVAARISEQTEHPFAALLVDQTQGARAGILFNSYAASTDLNAPQDLPALQACLGALAGSEARHVA